MGRTNIINIQNLKIKNIENKIKLGKNKENEVGIQKSHKR